MVNLSSIAYAPYNQFVKPTLHLEGQMLESPMCIIIFNYLCKRFYEILNYIFIEKYMFIKKN